MSTRGPKKDDKDNLIHKQPLPKVLKLGSPTATVATSAFRMKTATVGGEGEV